ncbi:hypothetical protein OIDMADRAFT_20274 [Oidiodendron maius Zn]|uniref:Uncharacterized protein n=1 Tax=Oidiodendron maius (strain Zn) TaxID=913774 RepID=A0A0C3H5X9_OIDMZ|nr:hypothetical protein OIDMADRAFT_20274 [Oidiodendron maius Zn]
MQPIRDFSRRPLRPPTSNHSAISYAEAPESRGETFVRNSMGKVIRVVEFSSQAVPQPFLDPSVIQRRVKTDNERNLGKRNISKQEVASPSPS